MEFLLMKQENRQVFTLRNALRYFAGIGLLVFVLLNWTQISVKACGYHDSVNTRKGALNWVYPNSLHVRGAIWHSQAAGELPTADAASYQKTERALNVLGDKFGRLTPGDRQQRFSVVLVETVLWSQFTLTDTVSKVEVDVDGPFAGYLVVVTDEPVVYALEKETITLSMAVDSGLVKLYGQPEQVESFLELYGETGGKTLNY